jgi:mono/diheme cytochrome c family protein
MMGNLERHFGVDASLDERTAQLVGQYLVQNAGPERRAGRGEPPPVAATASAAAAAAPLLRISDAPWFVREHREVSPAILAMQEVGSISNCAACHTDATQGRFSESALRMPGGARNGRGFGEEHEHENGRGREHDRD